MDAIVWTDDVIDAQITSSVPHFNVSRWGDLLPEGQGNWIAHKLALSELIAILGTDFGTQSSVSSTTEKTVGKATIKSGSTRQRNQSQADNVPKPWSLTAYGVVYYQLMRQVGAGAAAVGARAGLGGRWIC